METVFFESGGEREILERAKEGMCDLAKHLRAPIKLRPLPDVILPGNTSKMDSVFRRNWLPIFARRDCDDSRFPTR